MDRIQILLIVTSILFVFLILGLTIKNKLREQYSLIWLLAGFIMLSFSIFRKLLDYLAAFFDVHYAPSLIILILIFIGFFLGIHFSIVISKLNRENKKLTQEIAILENRIEKLERKITS